jgi:hypothetical protein
MGGTLQRVKGASYQGTIRRAEGDDRERLTPLIREFYDIDGHAYDSPGLSGGLDTAAS